MAGTVKVEGQFEPGETVEIFPAVDLVPRGRPIKSVKVGKDGVVEVKGLEPGGYFLEGGRRVAVTVHEAGQVHGAAIEREELSEDEIRAKLTETRPPAAEGEVVSGARSTADKPKRKRLLGRKKK